SVVCIPISFGAAHPGRKRRNYGPYTRRCEYTHPPCRVGEGRPIRCRAGGSPTEPTDHVRGRRGNRHRANALSARLSTGNSTRLCHRTPPGRRARRWLAPPAPPPARRRRRLGRGDDGGGRSAPTPDRWTRFARGLVLRLRP